MSMNIDRPRTRAAEAEHAAILVSLELSQSKWLVTSLLPDEEKMSKHVVAAGKWEVLLELLERRRRQAERRLGRPVGIVTIQEAGLDGFWLHRRLEREGGLESHVVDAASVAVPRKRRRAKSDSIDGETLLRTLAAWRRGEPRVCSMVRPPSPEEEDSRRLVRERAVLVQERNRTSNRIHGLLASQGITTYQPMRRDRRQRLEELNTGDGRALPPQLKGELLRALGRLELLLEQIKELEEERDAAHESAASDSPARLLLRLRSIGSQTASTLAREGFFREFRNRRQVGAFAGLAPSPWQSGKVERDQGISKAGNAQLRKSMIELAWLWRRYQPGSALSQWFARRARGKSRRGRRILIVGLARKLLVALWRYVSAGVVPEGVVFTAA